MDRPYTPPSIPTRVTFDIVLVPRSQRSTQQAITNATKHLVCKKSCKVPGNPRKNRAFWVDKNIFYMNGSCQCANHSVVGNPRITDPQGSKNPPSPPPQNDPRITDHLPHKSPPPLPSKMIHDFPDHRCRHVMIQRVVIVTHSASTKHHIDQPICVKKRSKNVSSKKEMTQIGGSFLFWNLHFWITFFPHKLVDHFFFRTCIFGSFLSH